MEIKTKAKEQGVSISKYVNDSMRKSIDDNWPEELFELWGSCKDDPVEEPEEIPWELNIKRDKI
jgi:hypothetical protein